MLRLPPPSACLSPSAVRLVRFGGQLLAVTALAVLAAAAVAATARAQQEPLVVSAPAPAPPADVEARVQAILSQMTTEEKILYIGGTPFFDIKPLPRFGLPQIFITDGPIGVRLQPSTRYPAGIALAATWNRNLAEQLGTSLGRDCRARGYYAVTTPGLNLYRLPLGGRNAEYMTGEDPYIGMQLAPAMTKGIQDQGVWAFIKHYVANDEEFKRNSVDIEVSERALREIYLAPFEATVKVGQAAAVMGAYNRVNGDYACENYFLDTQVLKQEWGFPGPLISDYEAIHDGPKAALAGCDLDLPFSDFFNQATLGPLVANGTIPTSLLDDKVRRILRKVVGFGFLDRPQLDPSIPLDDPASGDVAQRVARQSMTLLRNQGNLLPLSRPATRRVAVLGRAARGEPPTTFGSSYVQPLSFVSELSGITERAANNAEVDFIPNGTADPLTSAWESLDANGYLQNGLRVEYFNSPDLSGSPVATANQYEVDIDWQQTPPPGAVTNPRDFSARWTGQVRATASGDHLFKVRADGEVRLTVNGQVVIDTFGKVNPPGYGATVPSSAKVSLQAGLVYPVRLEYHRLGGFPGFADPQPNNSIGYNGGLQGVQFSWVPLVVPADLSAYDAVVLCVGIDNEYEGEGLDRPWNLPEFQDELIANAAAANPRTVVVLHGGGGFNVANWIDRVAAVLHAWYPGQYGGLALGEILFGDINPSGKLPITLERRLEDNPAYANYPTDPSATAIRYTEGVFVGYRGYERNGVQPQFPFGFGLSYTTFAYSDLVVTPDVLTDNGQITVSFTVTNTGNRRGSEVAQLYLGKRNSKVLRPIKELKGFEKVNLQPGESRRVTLTLDERAFAYFSEDRKAFTVENGGYDVLVGASSQDQDIRLRGRVRAARGVSPDAVSVDE